MGHVSISGSEVHAALKRLERARLLATDPTGTRPLLQAVEEFLVHGVKYAFPAKRGEVTRGVPTSYAGPPLNGKLAADDLPPVWPHPEGAARGVALEPLSLRARRGPSRSRSVRVTRAHRRHQRRPCTRAEAGRGRAPRTNPPDP